MAKLSEALKRLTQVRFVEVKCPTCGAQPGQNQNNWREARRCVCPERKALARKVAGILRAHFVVAERPCTGEAHSAAVGGMIDHCAVCMPRWGTVEYLTPIAAVSPTPEKKGWDGMADALVKDAAAQEAYRAEHAAALPPTLCAECRDDEESHATCQRRDCAGRDLHAAKISDTQGRTLATAPNLSWKPEVIADGSGKWCGNALRFATKEEAEANVFNLSMRWMLVRDTRVVESDEPVNYQWDVERGLVGARKGS
jgi:hypothetical protein